MDRILQKILSGRWLVTVILTIVFSVLAITGRVTNEYIVIYSMIVSYYFGKERADNTQLKATSDEKDNKIS